MADAHPMGSRLSATSRPVTLFVEATADPSGGTLQRIQVVRVTQEDGQLREQVIDIVGEDVGSVDTASCQTDGAGWARLCSTWTDPSPPTGTAAYYARVLETPSCRWSQHACQAAKVDCSADVPRAWSACCAPEHQPVIQERAWSSPIWWSPG